MSLSRFGVLQSFLFLFIMGLLLSCPIQSQFTIRTGNSWLRVGSSEMQGWRSDMEDAHTLVLDVQAERDKLGITTLPSSPMLHMTAFFAVFDGHSGSAASKYLQQELRKKVAILENPFDQKSLAEMVIALDEEFCKNVDVRRNGSTVCFAVITKDTKDNKNIYRMVVGNVGDSRCLLIKPNGKICLVTTDHKPDNEDEWNRIYSAGGTVSFGRVDGELAMSRAFGDWPYKSNQDLPRTQQKVISRPDFITAEAEDGDLLCLCCDGLFEKLSNEQVAAFITVCSSKHPDDPAEVIAKLIGLSLLAGSTDNMSAMLVQFVDGSDYHGTTYFPGPLPKGNMEDARKAYNDFASRHNTSITDDAEQTSDDRNSSFEAWVASVKAIAEETNKKFGMCLLDEK